MMVPKNNFKAIFAQKTRKKDRFLTFFRLFFAYF